MRLTTGRRARRKSKPPSLVHPASVHVLARPPKAAAPNIHPDSETLMILISSRGLSSLPVRAFSMA